MGEWEIGEREVQDTSTSLGTDIWDATDSLADHESTASRSCSQEPSSLPLPLSISLVTLIFLSPVLLDCISEHCADWSTCLPSSGLSEPELIIIVYNIWIIYWVENKIICVFLGGIESSIVQAQKFISPASDPVSVNEALSNGWEDLESHY